MESTKTVGLTNLLIAEADRPRCDVFWNNEALNTVRIREMRMLQAVELENGKASPDAYKRPFQTARVRREGPGLAGEHRRPRGRPAEVDRGVDGAPMEGASSPSPSPCSGPRRPTRRASSPPGAEKAKAFFQGLKANDVKVLSGNLQVAQAVGDGEAALGLTDTDDALVQIAAGKPVAIVYLDREPGQLGASSYRTRSG